MSLTTDLIPAHHSTETINLACVIQALPAPTFDEARRATFFLEHFETLGLQDIQRDPVGNVLARLPGKSGQREKNRPLIVSAHMDTVFPLDVPLSVSRAEGRITGPGIGDNAIGLAAVISLVGILKEKGAHLPGDLWLVMNVAEEGLGDLRGIQAIVDRFRDAPLAYLVVEGMGLGTILHRGLGVERYKISVQTPGGHSWVDYGRPSAIHELCGMVNAITSLELPSNPCTTLNIGMIQGGTSVNTIAAHAWMELDLRSEDRAALSNLVKSVTAIVDRFRRPGVSISIDRIGRRLAGQLPIHHPLVQLGTSTLSELGIESRLDIASTDANLPISRGYPSICVGITHGNNAHTTEEYILTAPVVQGLAQLYLLVTKAWEELSKTP